jgi:hypothetical protein
MVSMILAVTPLHPTLTAVMGTVVMIMVATGTGVIGTAVMIVVARVMVARVMAVTITRPGQVAASSPRHLR